MAARILLETALVYDELLARDPDVRRQGKLPPVLPIVVYTGEEPWRGPTCMADLLADEALAFLPYALGHTFVLVDEAKEAQALETADTAREAALQLRYARSGAEFEEALAKCRELMPEAGQASRALAAWVRRALIDDGAKEADMENVQELRDLEPVVHSFWGAERLAARREGRAEGRAEGREEGREEGRLEGREERRAEGRAKGRPKAARKAAPRWSAWRGASSARRRRTSWPRCWRASRTRSASARSPT